MSILGFLRKIGLLRGGAPQGTPPRTKRPADVSDPIPLEHTDDDERE
jgi:hypothetical protein